MLAIVEFFKANTVRVAAHNRKNRPPQRERITIQFLNPNTGFGDKTSTQSDHGQTLAQTWHINPNLP